MEGPLQKIVTTIEESSNTAANLKTLLTLLTSQEELLIKHMPQLDDLLPVLNPATHTLGMVFILNCKAAAVPLGNLQAVNVFLRQCRRMLLGSDPLQVQLVPSQFVAVCTKFSAAAIAIKSPLSAVRPLQAAACALQPSPAHFTPLHAEFMKVCLLSKCYFAAQPLLDQELLQVDKEATLVTPRDLLLYHYYAGMIEIGHKRFKSAIQYLTLAFSAPTHVLNAIMVEAYKKCVLCALIETGEAPRVPKYTALVVQRQLKATALAPYHELADAFVSHKVADLRAALEKYAASLQADHNLGLGKQCVEALKRRNIYRLTRTYLTLSLVHIAENAQLDDAAEAEKYVCDMVASGDIFATINQPQGMVQFDEREERFDSHDAAAVMEASIGRAIALAQKLQQTNVQLTTDHNYLSRIASQERQPRWEEDAMLAK